MADPEKNANLMESGAVDVEKLGEEEEDDGLDDKGWELPAGLGGIMPGETPEVKKRIKALKKLQLDVAKIEAKFFEEMHALETKYLPLYMPLFEKRRTIVSGEHEPTEDECDFPGCSDQEDMNESLEQLKITDEEKKDEHKDIKGIPLFWLTIFKNVESLSEMVFDADIPILKHLEDIKVEITDKPMGFKLLFYFSPNEYFTNTVLTKTYEMKCEVDPEDPFSFEGPEIVKCIGCPIDWNKGKNVTVKTLRKKQKHKQRGSIRTVSKTVEADSFFNFFNPPQVPDDNEAELDDETQIKLTSDFEIGQYIRERIVPRAVLYFTGEALDEEFEEEEEEEEDDDEEEEEEEDGERPPGLKSHGKGRKKDAGKQHPDCKQQ